MKRILNFLITVLILFFAGKFFPANVRIDNFGWLLLTAALIWVVYTLVVLSFIAIMTIGAYYYNIFWVIISIIGIIFSDIITILLLCKWLSGFYVSGFWTAFLLSFIFSLFYLSEPSKTEA